MNNNFDENYIIELVKKELSKYLTDQGIEIKKEVCFLGDDNEIKEQLSQKFNFSENAKTLIVSQLSLKNLYNISNAIYENEYEEKIIKFLLENKDFYINSLTQKEEVYGKKLLDLNKLKELEASGMRRIIVENSIVTSSAEEYAKEKNIEIIKRR